MEGTPDGAGRRYRNAGACRSLGEDVQSRLARLLDYDDPVETADSEDLLDVFPHGAENDPPLARLQRPCGEQSDPQTDAADEVETAEIDDQMPLTAVDVIHDDLFERAGVPAVQTSDGEQHEHIVMPFFRNFDIHR